MTDAAEAELREIRKLWDEMQYIRTGGINALFAHIDALAAEVERLKKHLDLYEASDNKLVEGQPSAKAQLDSLRDLVREAAQLIKDHVSPCECKDAFLAKAAKA